MQIELLKLTSVTGCRDMEVPFNPGFNVILGGNGSGKSLCLWGIRAAFLGSETPQAGEVVVVLCLNGERVTLERDLQYGQVEILVEDSQGNESVVYNGAGEGDAYEDALNRVVGWSVLERWLQFGLVAEDGLGDISRLTGAKSPVEEGKWVLAELTEAQANLIGDNNGHAGVRDVIDEDLAKKLDALEHWEDSTKRLEALQDELAEIRVHEAESTKGADERTNSYRNLVQLRDYFEERDSLKRELAKLGSERDEVKHLVEKCSSAEEDLEREYGTFLNAGTDLEDALQEWSDGTNQLHEVQRRMHLAHQALANAPKGQLLKSAVIMVGGMGVLGYFAALGAGLTHMAHWMAVGVGAVGFGAAWVKHQSTGRMVKRRREELVSLEEENRAIEASLEAIKETMGKLGDLGHPMAIRRAVIQYWKVREDVERIRTLRDERRPLIDLIDAYDEKKDDLDAVNEKIRDLKAGSPYLADFDGLSRTLNGEVDMAKAQSEASQSRADRIGEKKTEILKEMERICEESPPLSRLERERKELARRKEQVDSEAEALGLCLEVWQQSLDEFRKLSQERMASVTGEYFQQFTEGKYQAVRLQGKDLEVKKGHADWSSIDTLSGGTLEQLGMAMRLAEASLNPGAMVLDNVFLRWDEERCQSAKHALRELVKSGVQVLLFTHHSHYAEWGDSVLSLEDMIDESAMPKAA